MTRTKWSKKKKLIVSLLIALAVVGAGLAFYVFYGYKYFQNDDSQNNEPIVSTSSDTIATIIGNNAALSKFNQLLTASGVNFTLQTAGANYLVLAPRNSGFDALPEGYFDSLLTTEKQAIAQNIAKYSVLNMPEGELTDAQKLITLASQEVILTLKDGEASSFTDAKGNVANVLEDAIKAANGTIYVVDLLLLPQ